MEGNRLSADDAGDLPAHDNLAAGDHSRRLPFFADNDFGCLDIAFNLAIDLQDSPADDLQTLADDLEVIANDRFLTTRRRAEGTLWTVGASWTGRTDDVMSKLEKIDRRLEELPQTPSGARLGAFIFVALTLGVAAGLALRFPQLAGSLFKSLMPA